MVFSQIDASLVKKAQESQDQLSVHSDQATKFWNWSCALDCKCLPISFFSTLISLSWRRLKFWLDFIISLLQFSLGEERGDCFIFLGQCLLFLIALGVDKG